MILSSSAIALFPSATTLAASSYQLLSRERRVCELECLRVQPAADAQRHAERGDEPEAPAALVVPRVLVWIKRQPARTSASPRANSGLVTISMVSIYGSWRAPANGWRCFSLPVTNNDQAFEI
jgi:hypothetical protein